MSSTPPIPSSEPAPVGRDGRPWPRFELATGVMAMFTGGGGGVRAPPFDTLNLSGAVGDLPAAVACNRALLGSACGPGGHPVAWMRQVHGSAVCYAGPTRPAGPEADGIFTDVPGLPLG